MIQSLMLLFLLAFNSTLGENKHVIPSCAPTDKICEFDFTVTAQETMVYYDRSQDKGFPVLKPNETYYRRLPDNCVDLEELSDEELSTVVTADGNYRLAYFINNQMPGPNMVVYEGQQVVVRVHNRLLEEGLSIHWHGMVQRNTPWMDGVAGVTQCAINTHESFTYRFIAEPAGTHWYHSHLGPQRTDGLFGALIVLPLNNSDDRDANRTPKTADDSLKFKNGGKSSSQDKLDDDESPDSTNMKSEAPIVPVNFTGDYLIMVNDWFKDESKTILTRYLAELQRFYEGYDDLSKCHYKTQQPDGSEVGTIAFESGLINGKGHFYPNKSSEPLKDVILETFEVTFGGYYRFRVINPSLNFAFKMSIDQHMLTVIASDGNPIVPVQADAVVVHAGERYDFYIDASQTPGQYWIRAQTTETYNGRPFDWDHPERMEKYGEVLAILNYTDTMSPGGEYPETSPRNCSADSLCVVVNCPFAEYPNYMYTECINMQDIRSSEPHQLPRPDQVPFHEFFLNFHFPASKGGVLRSMVNGRQFVHPSSPPLTDGGRPFEKPCNETACMAGELCECSYTVQVTRGSLVQMVLMSHVTPIPWEGVPASAHPVHLHGHHFNVMKIGYPQVDLVTKRYLSMNSDLFCPTDRCHNATWSHNWWHGGHVPGLNEIDPPLKDTVIVPAGGYVVIRFIADNPGWWLMHCHLELHQVEGMALLLQEGQQSEMNPPPRGFPDCHSFDWSTQDFEDKLRFKPLVTETMTSSTTMPTLMASGAKSLHNNRRISTVAIVFSSNIIGFQVVGYLLLLKLLYV